MVKTVLPTPPDETPQPTPIENPPPETIEPPPLDRICAEVESAPVRSVVQPSVWPHVIEKVTSGRWLCTLAVSLAFLICVWRATLPSEAIASIITGVLSWYFLRGDRNGTTNNKETQ